MTGDGYLRWLRGVNPNSRIVPPRLIKVAAGSPAALQAARYCEPGEASSSASSLMSQTPALLAQNATAYRTKLAASGVEISFGEAVRAVNERKTV